MGKTKKRRGDSVNSKLSLPYQLTEDKSVKARSRKKSRYKGDDDLDIDETDDQYVSDRITKKILIQARQQQEELEEEHGSTAPKREEEALVGAANDDSDESDHDSIDVTYDESTTSFPDVVLTQEDEKAFERFRNQDAGAMQRLADLFKDKLTEKQTEIHTQFSDSGSAVGIEDVPESLVKLLRTAGRILSTYTSGKLPKVLNMLPQMRNFEQLLHLLSPDSWSAAAMRTMTMKCMSTKPAKAQRFVNLVLLPRIRDDVAEFKRLNFHLYEAIMKTLYKPKAFFGGIVLPMCERGDCTLREATIIASVITKISIPPLHVATAIMMIADLPYSGASSIFMRALLGKKKALPYSTVDAVVAHFLRFSMDKRHLPVLWHQCLLIFVQHYKEELTAEQKSELLDLLKIHRHPQITSEIYREFEGSKCRGDMN